jgi:hypothetical protein
MEEIRCAKLVISYMFLLEMGFFLGTFVDVIGYIYKCQRKQKLGCVMFQKENTCD